MTYFWRSGFFRKSPKWNRGFKVENSKSEGIYLILVRRYGVGILGYKEAPFPTLYHFLFFSTTTTSTTGTQLVLPHINTPPDLVLSTPRSILLVSQSLSLWSAQPISITSTGEQNFVRYTNNRLQPPSALLLLLSRFMLINICCSLWPTLSFVILHIKPCLLNIHLTFALIYFHSPPKYNYKLPYSSSSSSTLFPFPATIWHGVVH